MPEISRFFGIVIRMYYGDHAPPHFHAVYGEWEAQIDIRTLAVIEGRLPPRALGLVAEWAELHSLELMDAWKRAQAEQNPGRIEPLR